MPASPNHAEPSYSIGAIEDGQRHSVPIADHIAEQVLSDPDRVPRPLPRQEDLDALEAGEFGVTRVVVPERPTVPTWPEFKDQLIEQLEDIRSKDGSHD